MTTVNQKYYDIVQSRYRNADAFFTKVETIANKLGIKAEWINDVIYIETDKSFSPSEKNPNSSATGLIQFMESTAKWMKTNTAFLATLTNIQQLDYVYLYFNSMIRTYGKPKDGFDLYLMVFYPFWIGKPDSATMNAFAAKPNMDIDKYFGNKDGIVTKGEFRKFYQGKIPNDSAYLIKKESA